MPRPWKTADMPVILSPSDGIDLRYDVAGTGPPLVLLHGSVLSRAIWRGLGYLEPLTEVRTVIRMDLRGHGRSGAPHQEAAYTQERFVADLLAVLDAEGHDRAALMGYSLGARRSEEHTSELQSRGHLVCRR